MPPRAVGLLRMGREGAVVFEAGSKGGCKSAGPPPNQLVVKGAGLRSLWAPKAPDAPQAPKAPEGNHLEEGLLDQAQA